MKKVLIYMKEEDLKPVGGPRGYLYNLKKGLDGLNQKQINFIKAKSIKSRYHKIYDKLPLIIKQYYREKIKISSYKKLLDDTTPNKSSYSFEQYEIIHFHSTTDMYKVKDTLKEYKGKVLLTSHTPKPNHLEIYEDSITEKERKKYGKYYEKLNIVDEYAFNRADYIIFPCEEAEEPYYNRWEKYEEIKEKKKDKYRYILTGIQKCKINTNKEEIRKKYNIPEDAFVISYIGRHNEVKGYDLLKEIGEEILNNKNVYILVAGNEGPLYAIKNKKWIEVGWTNDPYSIIASSDLFILPNKETYFDLVLLEVLSLGVPVLMSQTGGNKYFNKFDSKGIKYFKNKNEAVEKIKEIINLDKIELKKIGKNNKKIFEENFTCETFAKNYIELINSLN